MELGQLNYLHPLGHSAGWGRWISHTPAYRSSLQCVPFARENSGIEITGNAVTWWDQARGVYERGSRPEVGSVLNFRATGHMRMGHVAVVTNVVDARAIEIDHANWASPGRISHAITVLDVSDANDWTAVRVELGHTDAFGSTYPTYGFIYDRPDRGVMVANAAAGLAQHTPPVTAASTAATPIVLGLPTPLDEEVAEAPGDQPQLHRVMSRRGNASSRHHGRVHS